MEFLWLILSLLSTLWLVVSVVIHAVGSKMPYAVMEHNVIKLWKLQEIGRTRPYGKRDLLAIMSFGFFSSLSFPELSTFFTYLCTTILITLALYEPIVLFRHKHPKRTRILGGFTLLVILVGFTLTILEFFKAI